MDLAYATTTGVLFQEWTGSWGLRGDPCLWDEMGNALHKEPLPASVNQLNALLEHAFEQLVGAPITTPEDSVYIRRYDRGDGMSGGHVCIDFWRSRVFPELQRKYLMLKASNALSEPLSMDLLSRPRPLQLGGQPEPLISKPCRFEFYPEGCRYGTACRFRHTFPIKPAGKVSPTSVTSPRAQSNQDFGLQGPGLMSNGRLGMPPAGFSDAPSSLGLFGNSQPSRFMDLPGSRPSAPSMSQDPFGFGNTPDMFCMPARGEMPPASAPKPRSSSVCIHFLRGKCTFGAACRFAHF